MEKKVFSITKEIKSFINATSFKEALDTGVRFPSINSWEQAQKSSFKSLKPTVYDRKEKYHLSYNNTQNNTIELLRTSILNLLDSYLLFSEDTLKSITNPSVISYYSYMDKAILSLYQKIKYCETIRDINISKNIEQWIDKTEKNINSGRVSLFYQIHVSKSIDYLSYMLNIDSNIRRNLDIK